MREIRPLNGRPRETISDVGDGTGVVDIRYVGGQEPGATGPLSNDGGWGDGVDCGGHLDIHNDI